MGSTSEPLPHGSCCQKITPLGAHFNRMCSEAFARGHCHCLIPPLPPPIDRSPFRFFLAHQNCVMRDSSNSQGEDPVFLRLCVPTEANGRPSRVHARLHPGPPQIKPERRWPGPGVGKAGTCRERRSGRRTEIRGAGLGWQRAWGAPKDTSTSTAHLPPSHREGHESSAPPWAS